MNNSVNSAEDNFVPTTAKRTRRTPEQARQLILDAADAVMGLHGPAGLRLTQVAAEAGVSHPTLLHHFKSREGLVRAVHQRTIAGLRTALVGAMRDDQASSAGIVGLVFAAYRSGLAERLVWMMQSGLAAPQAQDNLPMLEDVVRELHALRLQYAPKGATIDERDSRAVVHLTAIAAFGDAIIGPRLRGLADPAAEATARDRFEHWFGTVINLAMAHAAGDV